MRRVEFFFFLSRCFFSLLVLMAGGHGWEATCMRLLLVAADSASTTTACVRMHAGEGEARQGTHTHARLEKQDLLLFFLRDFSQALTPHVFLNRSFSSFVRHLKRYSTTIVHRADGKSVRRYTNYVMCVWWGLSAKAQSGGFGGRACLFGSLTG